MKHICLLLRKMFTQKNQEHLPEKLSVVMLNSMGVDHAIIGHSESREYFNESNQLLAEKVKICLEDNITPIFCCGEALDHKRSKWTK